MGNLEGVLDQLREQRSQAEVQIQKLDSAITVLADLVGRNGLAPVQSSSQRGRVVSAVARRRMAAAQRARWAKVRQQAESTNSRKASATPLATRTLSATARRKIAAAQKARWAKFRAQQAKKAA